MSANSDSSGTLIEEDSGVLDDKLLDAVAPNITVLEGIEEQENGVAICTRCRTITNSFLSSPTFHSRRAAKRIQRHSFSSFTHDIADGSDQRFILPSSYSNVDMERDDEELLIPPEEDLGMENGGMSIIPGADHCHTAYTSKKKSRRAITKLIMACCLTTLFMVGECIGGYLANSIAIMSDAAHLLSDLTSFIVSLVAIYLAMRPASKKMNYGYQRAEVLGAVISVLIIWLITGVLVYIAIERILKMEFEVDADTMIVVSAIGVVFNIVLGVVLHASHGGHGHSHGGISNSQGTDSTDSNNNVNIRAAFIHVLGDLIQSVGVLIAAYVIRFYPQYKIADPICTFMFSAIVIMTTIPILKDLSLVLMEGTPPGTDYTAICSHLESIPGVQMVHSLHVWALTLDKNALSVHLAINSDCDPELILKDAQRVIRYRHYIEHTTIQVERYQPLLMDNCQQCQPLLS